MSRRIELEFAPEALEDLLSLHLYIAGEAGGRIAGGYVQRIQDACMALTTFPLRGTRRDDLSPGVRTIGFERRATIAFIVHDDRVEIVRIFYGGRDFERLLGDD